MSFADWKKRSKLFFGFIARSEREGFGLEECCQAAYKAGERDGLKRGELRDGGLERLPRPDCTYADHSYPAYSAKAMRDAINAERQACANLMRDASLQATAESHDRFARYSDECYRLIIERSNV